MHTCFTPSIEALSKLETDTVIDESRPEGVPQTPLLLLNLTIDPDELDLDPDIDITNEILSQLIQLWYDFCLSLRSFIGDPIFKPFTK